MIGYLDALITALSFRDATETARLLEHPLARLLPAAVCDEAHAFARGDRDPLAVPLRTMQLRRQTAELLQEAPALADARPDLPPDMLTDAPARVREREREREPVGAPALASDAVREGPHAMAPARRARRVRPQQMELSLSA